MKASNLKKKITAALFPWLLLLLVARPAAADAPEAKLASEDLALISQGVVELAESDVPYALDVLVALGEGRVFVDSENALYLKVVDGFVRADGSEGMPRGKTRGVSLNNVARRALDSAISKLSLTDEDVLVRRAAAQKLSEYPTEATTELMRSLLNQESDPKTKRLMALAVAKLDLKSPDRTRRLAAAHAIQDSEDISLEAELAALVIKNQKGDYLEKDEEVREELTLALQSVKRRISVINIVANTIYGFSLGSVLVLAALGLAITFGLMRVINMAHGEMLMLGAYSTFFVREQFLKVGGTFVEWYLLLAVPFAFLTTFGVGVLLERLVIRHLYGRPLETLLATWGLSLILIQAVRVLFGAQNVTVANPDWLSGGFELMPALVVPYSRIAVLLFTGAVVLFVAFVLRGTSVGLKVRAVTQNREIAASLGIPTYRVDMWTFGLGSGLAGLGGVALSQLGNVGPELGQQHIIDSFVVVVMGGVGNILGTVLAGVGLGLANKVLEPSVGAVMGKIILLGMLILFIQWRPQGLFAQKGRAAEN